MLYAGIDIAKNKHDIAVLDNNGKVIVRKLQIPNNRAGFMKLQMTFQNLMTSYDDTVIVALEDTGHYSYNIISFLRTNGYPTFSYNPFLIKEFAQSHSLRKTKTDRKDAQTIARKLRDDSDRVEFESNAEMIELKYATRNAANWKEKCTKEKVSYTRILDIIFPELASVVGTAKTAKHNKYVYELLKKYPSPKRIAKARLSTLESLISTHSRKRQGREMAKAIKEAAKHSIGQDSAQLEFELLQTIDSIEYFNKLRKDAEKEVEKLMAHIDSPLVTIPGVGANIASVILAEIQNIHTFKTPAQILAYAGSEPSISNSGEESKGTRAHG